MKPSIVRIPAALGALAMLIGIIATIASGTFGEDAATFGTPLGLTSLVDLYIGLLFFWGWIVFRERKALPALIWLVVLLITGNLGASLYLFWAAHTSADDWTRFWFGPHAAQPA